MTDAEREAVIRGPRLALARFRESDLSAVHAFASDPLVCRFTTWGPNTIDDTRAFLAWATQPPSGGYQLAVMLDDELIGSAAVWITSPKDLAGEVGYTVRRYDWGRGYATEVATLLIQLGFEQLGMERLAATCAPENIGSVRVLEKAGFRHEGLIRGHLLVNGKRRDSLLFGLLRTDDACK
jgi:[ribosomal protein S5]-alanine N-acetyltransferase